MNIITSSQREPTDSQRIKAQNKLFVVNIKRETTGQKVSLNDRFSFLANCHILIDKKEGEDKESLKYPVSLVPYNPPEDTLHEPTVGNHTSPITSFPCRNEVTPANTTTFTPSPFRNFRGGSKYQPMKSKWQG
ncbi:unnamed protein product [Auanema sp. JU1783]|nr:unnamed protein product [Auanema sp. JU1783]